MKAIIRQQLRLCKIVDEKLPDNTAFTQEVFSTIMESINGRMSVAQVKELTDEVGWPGNEWYDKITEKWRLYQEENEARWERESEEREKEEREKEEREKEEREKEEKRHAEKKWKGWKWFKWHWLWVDKNKPGSMI